MGARMQLAMWMDKNGVTQRRLGEMFDPPVSQGLVWQWLKGQSRMSLEHALYLQDHITKGKVTVRDCAALYVDKEPA
jgi:hypothetical protein